MASQSLFLLLPSELRLQIYELVLEDWKNDEPQIEHAHIQYPPTLRRHVATPWAAAQHNWDNSGYPLWSLTLPDVSWVCQQIRREFLPMLYNSLLFEVWIRCREDAGGFLRWLDGIGDEGARLIRHLHLNTAGVEIVFDFNDQTATAIDRSKYNAPHGTGAQIKGGGYTVLVRRTSYLWKMEHLVSHVERHARIILGDGEEIRLSKTQLRDLVLGASEISEWEDGIFQHLRLRDTTLPLRWEVCRRVIDGRWVELSESGINIRFDGLSGDGSSKQITLLGIGL